MSKKVGYVGWRGMVGSVLMDRMKVEGDFTKFENFFFSTSTNGVKVPQFPNAHKDLLNSNDIEKLKEMEIIISCQGGDYTKDIFPKLRATGWNGYWIDAASAKRMDEDSIIILDPINQKNIEESINNGIKNFIGGNCTVSLMLMALGGLFKNDAIEWVTSMTYQAASGAGANNMLELLQQMNVIGKKFEHNYSPGDQILAIEKNMSSYINNKDFPTTHFGHPLAMNILPWIDTKLDNGQSREEWKAQVEANKILNSNQIIPIDGTCVRVGALRCHSQALTIKLKKDIPMNDIEQMIGTANDWVKIVDNDKEKTLKELTPAAVTGTLNIPIGRLRKMTLGSEYLNAFTVGDQLLWGAAEPLRRMLNILNNV